MKINKLQFFKNIEFIQLTIATALFMATAAEAAIWETILTCDNGAAIVQVNSSERRNYQMVVKDANIIVYFNGTGAFRNAGTNFGNGRELVVGGFVQNGIFTPNDFCSASGNYNYGDDFQIVRDQSGLKITLQNTNIWSTCDGDVSPSTGECNGPVRSGKTVHEYGNWYFNHCR